MKEKDSLTSHNSHAESAIANDRAIERGSIVSDFVNENSHSSEMILPQRP